MSQRLTDMHIDRLSLVDKGANGREFAILKRAGDGSKEGHMPDQVAKGDPQTTPAGQAGLLRKIADWLAGDRVAKAQTFATIVAGQELYDALDDSYDTLWSALWSAMWAYDEAGQDLPMVQKQALVAQNLDEFKAYLLAAMDTGVAKREQPTDFALAKRRVDAVVAKVGAKVSAARLERLKAAADALNSVLAEVDAETEKRADPQEDDMTAEELVAAITKAQEPILAEIAEIKKHLQPEQPTLPAAVEKAAEGDLTLEGVAKAVLEMREDLDTVLKARGSRTSAEGQEGETVAKRSVFAGVF